MTERHDSIPRSSIDQESLILNAQLLRQHAQQYDYGKPLLGDDDPCFPRAGDGIRAHGYVQTHELQAIARWKSPRRAELVKENPNHVVTKVTRLALDLKDSDPGYAASVLTILAGVGVPMASTVLTVADPQNFGIIDVRAWRTLNRWRPHRFPEKQTFTIKDFLQYLEMIRELARVSELSCREVDMALWQMAGETPT